MHRVLALVVAAACLSSLSGCASLLKKPVVKATPQNPAAEIVGLWQPAKGPGQNGLPTRGLAGRLMFFTRGNAAPAVVDGDVRVYLFDNQGTAAEQARPIHQFDFRAEDWGNFLQSSTLGPTYNLFIPYVRGGHKQVECTVQVRFSPKNGPAVYSEMTTVTLPGTVESQEEPGLAAARSDGRPSPSAALAEATRSRLAVHTIPQHRASHLRQSSPAATQGDALASESIQQTSYSVEPPPAAARIAELEELVRRLQADRVSDDEPMAEPAAMRGPRRPLRLSPAAQPIDVGDGASIAVASVVDDSRLVAEHRPSHRLRLRKASPAAGGEQNAMTAARPMNDGEPLGENGPPNVAGFETEESLALMDEATRLPTEPELQATGQSHSDGAPGISAESSDGSAGAGLARGSAQSSRTRAGADPWLLSAEAGWQAAPNLKSPPASPPGY